MSIFNKIKNRINKKERLEIETWMKAHAQIRKKYEDCFAILLDNRQAIHNTIDELKANNILSEDDADTFYDLLDDKYGYVKHYYEYWLKHYTDKIEESQ